MVENNDGGEVERNEREDNVVRLGIKPKAGSPVQKEAESQQTKEAFEEGRQSVIGFLEAHLQHIKDGKFPAVGAFLLVWGEDQTYIMNDAGMFPLATMLGLLDLAQQDFRMRHIMGQMTAEE